MTKRFNYKTLRATCRRIREGLSPTRQEAAAKAIFTKLIVDKHYADASHVALYQAHLGEISLDPVCQHAWLTGKQVYFPVMLADRTLAFAEVVSDTPFKANEYGILEPVNPARYVPCDALELIVLPLTVFDDAGNRLGMGSGYYDRTLHQKTTAYKMGVAYTFQQVSKLIPNDWDVPLDAVITPTTIYYWSR